MSAGIAGRTTGKRVRCAIYTRKSSDEGLEQAFNSLDAQREACAAYILSQASEGWTALPEVYDDGGLSGGTLERPALRRLLADVAAGRVDIIVVYKVDRLTRSLFDFAKLVETFDAAGTSFVSVTQSFNTTTSMGRLTLNMLLSFAQFEREVTAERIRDKIAASKARGMWMGGTPPLGYQPNGRTLTLVEDHAAIIRMLFERYLVLGNVRLLENELVRQRISNPVRTRAGGRAYGGGPILRGQIYGILCNAIYAGQIQHKGQVHPGQHPAIISSEVWTAVQAKLLENRNGERAKTQAASPSLLFGKVFDSAGEPLMASHANKSGKRYRYYLSKILNEHAGASGIRVPALELENAVTERIAQAFDDPFALGRAIWFNMTSSMMTDLGSHAVSAAAALRKRHRETVLALVKRVHIYDNRIDIECSASVIASLLKGTQAEEAPPIITLSSPVTLTRSGRAMRLIQDNGATIRPSANAALVKLLVKARRWWKILREGEIDINSLAASEDVQSSYVTRVVRLAFLSPTVTDAILKGTTRVAIDVAAVTRTTGVAAHWRDQAVALLPEAAKQ